MDIAPIRTETDYLAALAEVERLMEAEPGTPDADKLDILATLVERYEDRAYPLPKADPIEIIRYVMDERSASQKDLAALIGSKSRASEIMNRKRALNLDVIRLLNREWHIPVDLLVQEYSLAGESYAPIAQAG